jgi:hypothetical protein
MIRTRLQAEGPDPESGGGWIETYVGWEEDRHHSAGLEVKEEY